MGKSLRMLICIACIILCSCEKNETPHNYPYHVSGETITLRNQEWNELWQYDIADLELYKIEPDGTKIVYKKDQDYVMNGNKIKRTPNSRISDFLGHKVVYNSIGKFKWLAEPERNPELSLPYQIYADYNYKCTPVHVEPSLSTSHLLKTKLVQQKPLKMVTIGTSISFGAHTFENYYHDSDSQTYHQLVSKSLSSYYGVVCISINRSVNGGGVNQIQDLTQVLSEEPDVVFIELGMNDHLGLKPNIDYYKNSLDQSIIKLKEHSIDVILVGFFQQNESWEMEFSINTILYNEVLRELSQKHEIYFADIYTNFEKIDKQKLYKDYMGDYMHHPTSFTHQLYYLEIMPFFIDKPMLQDELLQYIY